MDRLERALAALRAVRAGEEPDLTDAPLLSSWMAGWVDGAPVLMGWVTGHPMLSDRLITTSVLLALNEDNGWARTVSRYYRLGPKAGGDHVH